MSKHTHTPGPWRAYKMPMNPWWHIAAESEVSRDVADIERPGSAMIFNNPHQASAVAADAALIAAAPDMLAALEAAHQFISNGIEFGYITMPDPSTPDSAHATPGIVRAALAKAKGE